MAYNNCMKTGTVMLVLGAALLGLSACSGDAKTDVAPIAAETVEAVQTPLEIAINAPERSENAQRDNWRHPKETLKFFGLAPQQTVVEIYPGGGWYADIIVPYVKATGGSYIAGGFPADASERFLAFNQTFLEKYADGGESTQVSLSHFGKASGPLGPENSADLVLSFRNVHNWMGAGYAEKAFVDFYSVLKSGGTLGVVEHRLPATAEQDPRAPSGYVQEAYVKKLAEEAGFEFVESSEINANPADTADHPLGVWTLPPRNRRENTNKSVVITDGSQYEAIGESDRMTLKFRKP